MNSEHYLFHVLGLHLNIQGEVSAQLNIMQTSPCNEYPLTPHFYIFELGFTRVYIFLIFALKHRLWVLVRTASVRRFLRVLTSNVLSKHKKNITFCHLKNTIFTSMKYRRILHGHVCAM